MIAVLVQIPIGDGEEASGSFLFTSQRKCVTVNAIHFFLFFPFFFLVCVLCDLPFYMVVMGWNLIYSYIMKMMFLYSFWHLSHHSLKHHEKKNHTKKIRIVKEIERWYTLLYVFYWMFAISKRKSSIFIT